MTTLSKNKRKAKRQRAYRRGLLAEAYALFMLRLKGYRLVARRYKKPVGEIDLLVRRGGYLIAVEVKRRQTQEAALHSIGPIQRRRIEKACQFFCVENPQYSNHDIRFDVVIVTDIFHLPLHLENAW